MSECVREGGGMLFCCVLSIRWRILLCALSMHKQHIFVPCFVP